LFEPVENTIRDQWIHTLIGHLGSDTERQTCSVFFMHGGLGLTNLQETANTEYANSTLIMAKLTGQIYNHKLDLKYNTSDQQYTRTIKIRILHLFDCKPHEMVLQNLFKTPLIAHCT